MAEGHPSSRFALYDFDQPLTKTPPEPLLTFRKRLARFKRDALLSSAMSGVGA